MLIGTRRALLGGRRKFSPLDIAGLQLWLKADAGMWQDAAKTVPAALDGDVVGAWADQSGNGNDVTEAVLAKKPLLKLAILNGMPVVRADGTDDILTNPGFAASNGAAALSVFMVFRELRVASNDILISMGTTDFIAIATAADATRLDWRINPAIAEVHPTPANWAIHSVIYDGTLVGNANRQKIWINGAAPAITFAGLVPATIGANNGLWLFTSHAGFPANADKAELLVYDSALSTADRQSVETYLNSRYAVY